MKHTNCSKKKIVTEYVKCFTILISLFLLILNNFFLKKTYIFKYITNFFLLLIITIILVQFTRKGKKLLSLIKEAFIEIKKVVYPTKRETLYTTIVIILVTFLTSIIVWGLDNILFYIISIITKMRI
ncbi:preprotein translocase subunit SecE [Buchnera aphidicola]|uniref:preprotein translocase subunit SecE n=1 Tax=Buchnera aphidicola TaxID=9 RepID=UPI00346467D9